MSRFRLFFFALILSVTASACSTRAPAVATFTGIANKVHDGDSIHLTPAGQERVIIRLAAIDAPELQQPYGLAARDHLRQLILNQQVEARCHKTDRYHRQLCVIYTNKSNVNLAMVSRGYAWHYKTYQGEQTQQQRQHYADAEKRARKQQRGLWRDNKPLAPWDYRS